MSHRRKITQDFDYHEIKYSSPQTIYVRVPEEDSTSFMVYNNQYLVFTYPLHALFGPIIQDYFSHKK